MITRIELSGDLPNFSTTAEFDGIRYALRFKWSERAAGWTVDLGEENEETWLACGRRLEPLMDQDTVLAQDMSPDDLFTLPFCVFGRFFVPGVLLAFSTAPLTTQAGLSAVELVYFDQEEMAVLAVEATA